VEHEEVDEELVAVDIEAPLPPDEREAGAELEQEPFDLSDEGVLEVALGGVAGQGQELEAVRVLDQLLHQLGVVGRQDVGEVRWGGAGSKMELGHDLVGQHRS
jgi:hypothetical protein